MVAVFDRKVEAYEKPTCLRTRGEALRMWETLCNDGKSAMSTHPEDFSLYELGVYNQATGTLTQKFPLSLMSTALECVRTPSGDGLTRTHNSTSQIQKLHNNS